jgi:hypothetical protein
MPVRLKLFKFEQGGVGSGAVTNNYNTVSIPYAADSGSANVLAASYSAITVVRTMMSSLTIRLLISSWSTSRARQTQPAVPLHPSGRSAACSASHGCPLLVQRTHTILGVGVPLFG